MTKPMVIKWLKWIKNCLLAGSEPEEAIDYAINVIESEIPYEQMHKEGADGCCNS